MTAHIERMQVEIAELDDKRQKLSSFIEGGELYNKLPAEDQDLMQRQLMHMNEYSNVLALRIERAVTV